MKKPNFFIIGAPKCGTTSLASWLETHPEIYFSPLKEPYFFSDDLKLSNVSGITTLEKYEQLFRGADTSHITVGEASTTYLYSQAAIGRILTYSPLSRFVVMLRNPIEMSVSLHAQQLYSLNENTDDFATAWNLQFERQQGKNIPPDCVDHKMLLYKEWCSVGQQLERLYEQVDQDRIKVVLLEDIKKQPEEIYKSILEFVGVSISNLPDFKIYNERRVVAMPLLHKFIHLWILFKRRYNLRFKTGLDLTKFSTKSSSYSPVSPTMLHKLRDEFALDIEKTGRILGRDLSHWLQ